MTAVLDELVDWWSWLLIAPAAALLAVAGSWLVDALFSTGRGSNRPASDPANAGSSEASGQQ